MSITSTNINAELWVQKGVITLKRIQRGFVINGESLQSWAVSPLITNPPAGLLASAMALRLTVLLLVLPNTT
jgi:hypothetical protein